MPLVPVVAEVTNQQVSPHFTLAELTHTNHRTIDNTPDAASLRRLVVLAHDLLEPLREQFGPLYVSSAYRSEALNTAIGGSVTSAHPYGCAADVIPLRPGVTVDAMVRWLRASSLPFDQAISEQAKGSPWLHVALCPPWLEVPRRECLRMRGGTFSQFPE